MVVISAVYCSFSWDLKRKKNYMKFLVGWTGLCSRLLALFRLVSFVPLPLKIKLSCLASLPKTSVLWKQVLRKCMRWGFCYLYSSRSFGKFVTLCKNFSFSETRLYLFSKTGLNKTTYSSVHLHNS